MQVDQEINHRIKLHDLRILKAVVEAGSMGKASTILGLSQPSISKSIFALENAVGCQLLERTGYGVVPTAYGAELVRTSVAALDELKQGLNRIRRLADPTSGELRIGGTGAVTDVIISSIIRSIKNQYPRVKVTAFIEGEKILTRLLEERKVDYIIASSRRVNSEMPFEVRQLFKDDLVIATGLSNKLANRRRVTIDELVNEDWVQNDKFLDEGSSFVEAFRIRGLDVPKPTVVTNSLDLRISLLAKGNYLTTLPRFFVMMSGQALGIKSLPIELENTNRTISLFNHKGREANLVETAFIDKLLSIAATIARS